MVVLYDLLAVGLLAGLNQLGEDEEEVGTLAGVGQEVVEGGSEEDVRLVELGTVVVGQSSGWGVEAEGCPGPSW